MARKKRDPVTDAARIVQDATEVDWSRDPATEYEAAIRAEYLGARKHDVFGRMEIVGLWLDRGEQTGSDLAAAAEEALRIIQARVACRERDALAEARRAVDARRPRGR